MLRCSLQLFLFLISLYSSNLVLMVFRIVSQLIYGCLFLRWSNSFLHQVYLQEQVTLVLNHILIYSDFVCLVLTNQLGQRCSLFDHHLSSQPKRIHHVMLQLIMANLLDVYVYFLYQIVRSQLRQLYYHHLMIEYF